jgi:nucleoid DNA-binding protein
MKGEQLHEGAWKRRIFSRMAAQMSVVVQKRTKSSSPVELSPVELSPDDARQIYEVALVEILEALCRTGGWQLPKGLGTFSVQTLRETRRRHPRTGELVKVPEREKVFFKAGKRLVGRLKTGKGLIS